MPFLAPTFSPRAGHTVSGSVSFTQAHKKVHVLVMELGQKGLDS